MIRGSSGGTYPFAQIASGLTPYAFLHIFPQDEHERLLLERLRDSGVEVERSTERVACTDDGHKVRAQLWGPDGVDQYLDADLIAGCDGARSTVPEAFGAGFPGDTYPQVFYVADVAGQGPVFNGDLNVALDESDFLAVFGNISIYDA